MSSYFVINKKRVSCDAPTKTQLKQLNMDELYRAATLFNSKKKGPALRKTLVKFIYSKLG